MGALLKVLASCSPNIRKLSDTDVSQRGEQNKKTGLIKICNFRSEASL